MEVNKMITDGIHYLSGIGSTTIDYVDVDLFCIDGVTYGAYLDPDDGLRSYGRIIEMEDKKCQYMFEPQKVVTEWVHNYKESNGWTDDDSNFLVVKDAILDKEVLRVGTNYADSYYPIAIFDYQPMNLYENVKRSIENAN